MPKFIKVKDAAAQISVHTTTLLRAIAAGQLKAVKVGREYRISEEALQAYLNSQTVEARPNGH